MSKLKTEAILLVIGAIFAMIFYTLVDRLLYNREVLTHIYQWVAVYISLGISFLGFVIAFGGALYSVFRVGKSKPVGPGVRGTSQTGSPRDNRPFPNCGGPS